MAALGFDGAGGDNRGVGSVPGACRTSGDAVEQPLTTALQAVHSGIVGDYVMWLVVGLALFAIAFY